MITLAIGNVTSHEMGLKPSARMIVLSVPLSAKKAEKQIAQMTSGVTQPTITLSPAKRLNPTGLCCIMLASRKPKIICPRIAEKNRKMNGVLHREDELRVLEHVGEVAESDEFKRLGRGARQRQVGHRIADRHKNRDDEERAEQHERREQKEQRPKALRLIPLRP